MSPRHIVTDAEAADIREWTGGETKKQAYSTMRDLLDTREALLEALQQHHADCIDDPEFGWLCGWSADHELLEQARGPS